MREHLDLGVSTIEEIEANTRYFGAEPVYRRQQFIIHNLNTVNNDDTVNPRFSSTDAQDRKPVEEG